MVFARGALGEEVIRIQRRLGVLGMYRGPADGIFGGGTEGSVKSFQKSEGLQPDGVVGDSTWKRLFDEQLTRASDPRKLPVEQRCLALSGSFETGAPLPDCFCGLAGDFAGQGISLGVLQWNIGQGTLQPLLLELLDRYPAASESVLHEHVPVVRAMLEVNLPEQIAWARSIQEPVRKRLIEPWRGMFQALGSTPEFQEIQVKHSAKLYRRAIQLCAEYSLATERAAALMFDILVENGSIGPIVKAQILSDYRQIAAADAAQVEISRMRSIAIRRSAAVRPEVLNDVRKRKLTIAEGEGELYGVHYNLLEQYGLGLEPLPIAAVNGR